MTATRSAAICSIDATGILDERPVPRWSNV
jgi:hypothetical protein